MKPTDADTPEDRSASDSGLTERQVQRAIAFSYAQAMLGAVVVLTIFSAMAFDPRLIWDSMEEQRG